MHHKIIVFLGRPVSLLLHMTEWSYSCLQSSQTGCYHRTWLQPSLVTLPSCHILPAICFHLHRMTGRHLGTSRFESICLGHSLAHRRTWLECVWARPIRYTLNGRLRVTITLTSMVFFYYVVLWQAFFYWATSLWFWYVEWVILLNLSSAAVSKPLWICPLLAAPLVLP